MMYKEIKEFLKVNELINFQKVKECKKKSDKEIKNLIDENKLDEATFSIMMNIGENITTSDLFEIMRNYGFAEYTRNNNSSLVFKCTFIYNKNFKIRVSAIEYERKLESINIYKLAWCKYN